MPFPEATKYRVPGNPFRGPLSQKLKSDHRESLQDALSGIRAPFFFDLQKPITFNGKAVGVETSTEDFNAALITVVAAVERGYYSSRAPTPLGPTEWAQLSCTLLAAIGRGYHRQYKVEKEADLDKVRVEAVDPHPLSTNTPTLFHRMASIADDISTHISPDVEDHRDWYRMAKEVFNTKATKAAAIEVEEKFLPWKANQFDRLANDATQEIADQTNKHGEDYLIATARSLGLLFSRVDGAKDATSLPTPLAGRKRSVTGSTPNSRVNTPAARNAVLGTPLSTPLPLDSPSSTPKGKPATLTRSRSRTGTLPQTKTILTRDRSASIRGRDTSTRDRSSSPPKRGRNVTGEGQRL